MAALSLRIIDRVLIQKGLGMALVLSGLVLLVLKLLSVLEAQLSWDAWAAPNSGTSLFIGALAAESILLAARFALGYLIYLNKQLGPWLFYTLAVLVAISSITGVILVIVCMLFRFLPGQDHEK